MKQYKIFESIKEMEFPWGKMNVISLGERGRGRWEELVPAIGVNNPECSVDVVKTKSGKPKIINTPDGYDESGGWLAFISAYGVYARGTLGAAYVMKRDEDRVTPIAIGWNAYGDAGRIGTEYQYLVMVKDETLVKVKPAGGGKTPPYYLYFDKDQVYKICGEEFLLFCDEYGIESGEFKMISPKE